MGFRTFKALDNEICGSHLGVTLFIFTGKFKPEEMRPLLIIFYSANVYLVPTITRNSENLFYYVSNTTVDLWWSHQYGRHWLHLCIADALSSPSFQISDIGRMTEVLTPVIYGAHWCRLYERWIAFFQPS